MLDAFSKPVNRRRAIALLVAGGLLSITAAALGISDNPPGILCAFLAASAFVLAFVHSWGTPKQFLRLLYASGLGLVVFGVLHNVFEGLAGSMTDAGLLRSLLGGAGVVFFLIAILLCPPGLVIGAVGSLVMFIRNGRRVRPEGPRESL